MPCNFCEQYLLLCIFLYQSKEAQQVAEEELTQVKLNQKKLEAMKKLIFQENERRKEEALKAKAKRKRQ